LASSLVIGKDVRLDDLLGSFDLDMTDASLQHAIKDLVSFFSLPLPVKLPGCCLVGGGLVGVRDGSFAFDDL
jgi:hypothetical protein